MRSDLRHFYADHFDRRGGTIAGVRGCAIDCGDDVHAAGDLAEYGVLGLTTREVVKEVVVLGVDEELAAARLGA